MVSDNIEFDVDSIKSLSASEIVAHCRRLVGDTRLDDAERDLKAWLSDQSDVWVSVELARILKLRGDETSEFEMYEEISRDFPHEVIGFIGRIDILTRKLQLKEAQALSNLTIEKFPEEVWAWDHAATVTDRLGQTEEAASYWRQAYRIAPHHQRAVSELSRISHRYNQPEFVRRILEAEDIRSLVCAVPDVEYAVPSDLRTTATEFRRGLIIGSCLTAGMPWIISNSATRCETDFILVNNLASLPASSPRALEDYDFIFVQIPLRAVVPEAAYLNLDINDSKAFADVFVEASDRLTRMASELTRWGRESGVVTFVSNFLVPQQNPMGRLLPKYDLRNFSFFVEELNRKISEFISNNQNMYLIDVDCIASIYGKRFIQDDMVWVASHGASLSRADYDADQGRLEAVYPADFYYPDRGVDFGGLIWRQIEAQYRTIQQVDAVKMVLVDLDDTLWRGVLAESGETDIEGWPLGMAEALVYLKRRGVLLGVVSKNTEEVVTNMWPYDGLLPMKTFASKRINWLPKVENISTILAEVNLLPKNVVYIDDNPVERASVIDAFPEMRVIGSNPYLWRRILLWSSETQVAVVTEESARRTEMIQAQTEREAARKTLSRGEFLSTLNISVTLGVITGIDDRNFQRAFELLNKTNQFNTTGKRWTSAEASSFFANNGKFYTLNVRDKYTAYGLVGVICQNGSRLDQFVMSCRVIGLDVELAAIALVVEQMREQGSGDINASSINTPTNLLSRDLWERCGFTRLETGEYELPKVQIPEMPSHVSKHSR